MAGKGGKTYNITEAQLEIMLRKASEAGIEAYKKECHYGEKRRHDKLLYKTKKLLENYTTIKKRVENGICTLEQAAEYDSGILEILGMTDFGIFDNDKTVHALKRGLTKDKIMLAHIDRMLGVFRESCEKSPSPAKQRQYRVIYHMYLADTENRMNTKEIAEMENEEIRTIQNDAKAAREDLTALIFGLDGILVRILGE